MEAAIKVSTGTEETTRYLKRRLEDIASKKAREARQRFFIDDDEAPSRGADMLARIRDGKFIFNEAAEKEAAFQYNPFEYIKWRDPSKPADEAGFKAWKEAMNADAQRVRDDIIVFPAEKGLESLRAFEAAQ